MIDPFLSSILFFSASLLCHIMAGPSWPCGGRTAWRSQQTGGLAFRPRWSRQTSRRSSPWETGCTSGWLVWRQMFRQCEWESRPLKMSFLCLYFICSVRNQLIGLRTFSSVSESLKWSKICWKKLNTRVKSDFSVSFPHVLFSSTCTQGVLTKWDTLTLETNFFWMMLNICDIWHSWIISQPAAGVFYDHILTVWQQLFLKGLFLLSQPVPGNNYKVMSMGEKLTRVQFNQTKHWVWNHPNLITTVFVFDSTRW